MVSALVMEDGSIPLAGKSVRIAFGPGSTSSCTGTTDASGIASCTVPALPASLGNAQVTATFAGDGAYLPASDTSRHVVVYGYVPRGAFVLGDTTAQQAAGTTSPITYWGVHWGKANKLSGGTPPASFFGYAKTLSATPPVCGSTWTTSPGATSLTPPIRPPAYMAVAVAGRITQSGNTISGNVTRLAIVKTGGALGSGTVLSTFCPQAGRVVGRYTTAHPGYPMPAVRPVPDGHRADHRARVQGAVIPITRVRRLGHVTGQPFTSRHATAATGTTAQQITFDAIPDHTFGDGSFSISAQSITSASTGTGGLPPDPSTVAPPLDDTIATTIGTATAFLYTGSNPIQTGVAPGTINPIRASVLRGAVLDKDGNPLSGATVSILDHPELGQTLSRADGRFDLAVNGGGQLTVSYTKDGFFPAQRQVDAPWQDYAVVPDVVMITQDPQVTAIDLTSDAPMQVAQGNSVTDARGTRQATLFIPQGTTATMTLPDGSTQPLSTLHVRATEYTVGPNGPEAMPASLPPTSGYTYAVDFSVDEAQAAGATGVQFNHPVISYLQNFLNFPVGMTVPVGSYKAGQGKWIPEDNGRVIKILSITNGMADLDVDGSGTAADTATLAGMGITDAERTQLASTYAAGDTLWRTPIAHFSPFDLNAPFGPPPDALPPNNPNPDNPDGPDGAPNPQNPYPPAGGPDPEPCNAGGIDHRMYGTVAWRGCPRYRDAVLAALPEQSFSGQDVCVHRPHSTGREQHAPWRPEGGPGNPGCRPAVHPDVRTRPESVLHVYLGRQGYVRSARTGEPAVRGASRIHLPGAIHAAGRKSQGICGPLGRSDNRQCRES